MVIHKPLHPGVIVRDALFSETGLSVNSAASKLGIDRTTLSRLINGHTGISPEMAMRLSLFLRTSPEMWMNLQRDYDLWLLKSKLRKLKVKPYEETA